MLTISDTEDKPSTSEKSKLLSTLSKLTPQTRALATSILGQRDRDDDEDDTLLTAPTAKHLCLDTVNREAHSLALSRINPSGKRTSKPPLVLDVEAFKKKYSREADLTRDQWSEAARNFTRFAGEVGRDGEQGNYFTRWDNHYGFFEERTDAAKHFQAILEVDCYRHIQGTL
ncbi:hypothetical protein PC9H_001578 [Pleurotus ostreatus]|uniref:Uncharacterized protein n=1 Tax=Pleurotus ostreatus TaxID=5322 RepID=A0A8H7DWB9_PLEOS|nr:uncharacterized protein PC9H_001578 [Pleurotus ostreatus]KAF7441229.1 hypothetical protein PC9H_001578 [Pleurotus ostreatus]